jgi:hypothetical protein
MRKERTMRKLVVTAIVVMNVGAAIYASSPQKTPVNPVGAATAAFQKRISDYMKLRGDLTSKIPEVRETGDPTKIHTREVALGKAIATARANAKPGDLFGHDMIPYFSKVLADECRTRSPSDRNAIFHELPAGVKLTINQPYPTTLPLLTLPANLLANLPMLPEELEYRLIDRHLLLRDRDANLIVDMLSNVFPSREG